METVVNSWGLNAISFTMHMYTRAEGQIPATHAIRNLLPNVQDVSIKLKALQEKHASVAQDPSKTCLWHRTNAVAPAKICV